ncbi:MAG TPA: ATP-binding protein [Wenzhouxiangella sp.]|nr:ATP-binding protein [Wenzhouxiangella sp.]
MAHVTLLKPLRSLRLQLVLLVILPLAVFGTLAVWLTYEGVEKLIKRRLQTEIELVARTLRVPVERAMQDNDREDIERTLDAAFEIGRVYGAYVYDAAGRRIAVAGEVRPGPREQIEAVELVQIGEETGRYAQLAGEPVFSYFVPLTGATGRIVGLLQVVRLESEIAHRLDEIQIRSWLAWAVVMVVMLLIVLFGHRLAVGRHVERLVDSMSLVESGDRSHRARVDGPTEIAKVAAALNRMLDGLDRMAGELSKQRRASRRMERRMLEQQNLARLGRFSSGVAHELGSPLTVIDGDARRLQRETGLSDDAARRLERIRRQVARTRELINQLMEFARSDRREPEKVNLQRLLRRVLAGVRPECESRGIELRVVNTDEPVEVTGWPARLEHALLNLVRNAVQAANASVRVTLGHDAEGQVVARVEDDGPGVPPDQRERIFEPFHTAGKGPGGTGLGLAIVHGVAEEHGASIEVGASEALGGSRMELTLRAGPA